MTNEKPSLVIIIDCWDSAKTQNRIDMMTNIRKFCFDTPSVKAIGLATYISLRSEQVAIEEPWTPNSKELFHDTITWDFLRKNWENTEFVPDGKTHEIIQTMPIRPDQVQFSIWNTLQLMYYCNSINTSIQNIFLLGIAWEVCLQYRPVGWKEIHSANEANLFTTKKNIFSNLSCTLDETDQFVTEVSPPWIKLDNNLVMLDKNQVTY